jgi:hypothetical protein
MSIPATGGCCQWAKSGRDGEPLEEKSQSEELVELKTPFVPAPIIDMLNQKGFITFSLKMDGEILTYIGKAD